MEARRAHNPEVVGSSPASATKEKPIHSDGFFFGYGCGLEEGGLAEGKAKKCPGDTFLARGRVHGWQAASGTGVDCHPFFCAPGYEHLIPVPKSRRKRLKSKWFSPFAPTRRRPTSQNKSSQRWRQQSSSIVFSPKTEHRSVPMCFRTLEVYPENMQ